jgi:catechol 2,3-dioxygenase-like lactoylglutathione lyase family enzyme
MNDPHLVILYVDDPLASADFYGALLGREPVEKSPTFVMFVLASGLMLGFWSRHTAVPAATAMGGSGELCIKVDDAGAVDATHADWHRRGLTILQQPTDLDFGRTFVASDPDDHRLRVYAPLPG